MAVRSSAGSSIGISASAPATYDVTGYSALTFTNIGEVTNLGDFGRVYELIRHNPIDTRATVKLKGSYDEGQIEMQVGLDRADAGQNLAKTASESDNDYSLVVTTQDGSNYYFRAKVMSFRVRVGSVNDITNATIGLELTSGTGGVGIVEDLA